MVVEKLMTPSFIQFLDFLGTFAFAVSGIRLASQKRFDLFGAYIVGLVTAIGGGTIRDLLLDLTPVWMLDPFYVGVTGVSLLIFIIFGKLFARMGQALFIFDAIGLALFTMVGFHKSMALGFPLYINIIMGTLTGAAGGVIRDVLINEIPLIFRKDIYAMACVIGGLVYWLCDFCGLDTSFSSIIGGVSVFVTRLLATKYHIGLPTLKGDVQES